MSTPFAQKMQIAKYIFTQKIKGNKKYPLVMELEPLYQCNLACAGCGKIQYPMDVLKQRLSVEDCIKAVEECGAPVISIAGGEPLVYEDLPRLVDELIKRNKVVIVCTNALLLEKKIDKFKPHALFTWMVHLDGLKERHDQVVCRDGTFDKAVAAMKAAKAKGFRVSTNTTFFDPDDATSVKNVLNFLNDEIGVDSMQISPGFAYEKAPDQEHFLGPERTRAIFKEAFADGNRKRWRLNHSPLFLDFLEGKLDMECTPWGIPSYSILGWQRPCYLMSDEAYAKSYKELIEETDWDKYGRGKHEKCGNCMAHCGYEPTAVLKTTSSIKESIRAAIAH